MIYLHYEEYVRYIPLTVYTTLTALLGRRILDRTVSFILEISIIKKKPFFELYIKLIVWNVRQV